MAQTDDPNNISSISYRYDSPPYASPARRSKKDAWNASSLSRITFFDDYYRTYSFGTASRDGIDKLLNTSLSNTVGPAYDIPSTIGKDTPYYTMPRASRESKRQRAETPGPVYDVGTKFVTETPSFSFGAQKRYADADASDNPMAPSPFSYFPNEKTVQEHAPAYSLAGKSSEKNRFFSSLLYLSESVSPGPGAFSPQLDDHKPTTQGETFFGTSKRPDLWHSTDTPASNTYEPKDPNNVSHEITFSKSTRPPLSKTETTNVPYYAPSFEIVEEKSRAYRFGKSTRDRNPLTVAKSPDVGAYSPKFSFVQYRAPSSTMYFKEKEYGNYGASPGKKIRFLSKQLSRLENQGTHGPGAKYNLPTTFSGPKYSFAPPTRYADDDDNYDRSGSHGRLHGIQGHDGKVQFNAADKMYLGVGMNKNRTKGVDSPGFVYHPKDDYVRPRSMSATIPKQTSKPNKHSEPPYQMYFPGLRALSTLKSETTGVRVGTLVNAKAGSRDATTTRSLFGNAPGRDSVGPAVYSPQLDFKAGNVRSSCARIGGLQ